MGLVYFSLVELLISQDVLVEKTAIISQDVTVIYIEEWIFRQQVVINASFIKDDGKLFIYYF